MTSTIELDHRVSKLEHFVCNELAAKVESMNWAIGQTYQSTEAMRIDIAGLHVDRRLSQILAAVQGGQGEQ